MKYLNFYRIFVILAFILQYDLFVKLKEMDLEEQNNMFEVDELVNTSDFGNEPDTSNLYILPARNLILFPGVSITLSLGRPSSLELAREANREKRPIGVVCQIDPNEDNPSITKGLYRYGVVTDVLNVMELPDGTQAAIIIARDKFRIVGHGTDHGKLSAKVRMAKDYNSDNMEELHSIAEIIKSRVLQLFKNNPENYDLLENLKKSQRDEFVINYVATRLPIDANEKIKLLALSKLEERGKRLLSLMDEMGDKFLISGEINNKTRKALADNQRQMFLQQQLETIREELYGTSEDEIDNLIIKAGSLGMPAEIYEQFCREAEKARHYNPQSPDYAVQYSYLELLTQLPWTEESALSNNIVGASEILDEDHFGLEKIKERVLEQLALLMHNPQGNAPILCLVGPPGVGKTSIGKSVARALGRKYERVSFGGLHDESEIRGHRKTYVGAMPGRIIAAMKRAGVVNPVIVLDEIDKIGADFKGDPASALLEVLDPEQNCRFHDNYVDLDYDLSKVLFIATANTLSTIAKPLLDRMEIIEISGYLPEEKVEIATNHLLPKICRENKLESSDLNISLNALNDIIEKYTSESGVRTLEKKLSAIARKAVLYKLKNVEFPNPVQPEHLYEMLGMPLREKDKYEGNDFAGVVTGLAWTEVGGEILLAESSLALGKADKPVLTGNLGNVMQESATIAYQWVKSNAEKLGISSDLFNKYILHIHFPEGAIPKDGPSAGITIATSIVSTFTQKKVAEKIAMTGEITLRGKVLPVGGIKEKILAAKRAGIKTIILSEQNKRDIEDIGPKYIEGLNFVYVGDVMDVLKVAITDELVHNPKKLN